MSLYNVNDWLDHNREHMLPPVCNKMMYNEGQMKLMFVGGPNQRKDYHIECGEELFLQLKGDMCVRVVEHGKHRDVIIKEGQMFLLPGRVPHSPQRYENTTGLVVERSRHPKELDGLRYYIEEDGKKTTKELYEAWLYCTDLGSQIAPVIKAFFASEQYRTGKPPPGSISANKPVTDDPVVQLEQPINFQEWIEQNRLEINEKGRKQVFSDHYQLQVFVFGQGENVEQCDVAETWIFQWEGGSSVKIEGEGDSQLGKDDSLLVPQGKKYTVEQGTGGIALVVYQDPTKSTTWPK